jgi:signal transduction histidine kinase/DNA-binding response OmpR family regulator
MLANLIDNTHGHTKATAAIRALLFSLLIILLFFTACSNSKPSKKFKVGFSQCANDIWRQNMQKEIERELSFHPELNFATKNAALSSEKQIQQIRELVASKIDLLIVSPNEAKPLTPIIDSIFKTGLPIIVVDRSILSNNYSTFIGASNYKVGVTAGSYANALLKAKGNIVEVKGLLKGSSADQGRQNGFLDFIKNYPGLNLITSCVIDTTKDGQLIDELSPVLKANKDIDLIYCHDDRVALKAYKIIDQLGLEKKIKIIGVDGLPGPNNGIDLVGRGMLDATILYPSGGREAIETAINILEKKPYSKNIELASTIIDSSNVEIMRLQNEKVIAQQEDIDKRQVKIEEQIAITRNQNNIIVAISITLALALILGGILYYYLQENKKINKKLEIQKEEIAVQRNQLIELVEKVKEADNVKFNFFTNISHELRTPLTLIMAPLEEALSSPKLHFTIKNNLIFIQRNALRLLRLINQLMDFRKIEEGKMRMKASENNITDFVSEITHSFHDLARKKSISLNFSSKAKDLSLWFDTTMLDKVMFNLLSNAIKFTSENGVINVSIDKSADGNIAKIKIEDSGIGMSTEDVQHAFEVFYQGHSSTFKGTGLGLALSKELIQLHHGKIDLKSEKGKGTIFEISLPTGKSHLLPEEILDDAKAPTKFYEELKIYTTGLSPMKLQKEDTEPSQKENSILIIEDNNDLRLFLENRLSGKYEIHQAETGEKGVELAFDFVPDLIISDIILPGLNGMQLTEKLKQDIRTSHIPIILLTAKGSIEEQIEGIKSQADAFIVKPFNLAYLEETIKTFLKNRSVLREHYSSELPVESRSNSSNKIDRKFITEFSSIVEKNISNESFSVDNICKEIGISRVQLYRKVKALLGYNVNDYILNVRMQKAKFLLLNEDLSISEIAFKVGFSTQAYFSTVFKSKFSITPSEYRDKKKGPQKKLI